jgi:hypothetical protein
MVWTYFAIAVNLFVCGVVAVPTQNDIAKSFQAAVHHQVFSDFVCFLLLEFDARRRLGESETTKNSYRYLDRADYLHSSLARLPKKM